MHRCYIVFILSHSGRVLEAYLNTERGVASRGSDSQPPPREVRDPARRALRPGREELAVTDPEAIPVREARDRSLKSPRRERREAGVPRHGTQGASLGAWPARYVQAQRVPRKHPYVSRRSATPLSGERSEKRKTRAQKMRRGNEEVLLGAHAFSSSFRPSRGSGGAGIHNHKWWVWIPGSQ